MTRYHHYASQSHDDGSWEHYIILDPMEECPPDCEYEAEYESLHVLTDAELRARDEAIIRSTLDWRSGPGDETLADLRKPWPDFDAIIAAADTNGEPT